MGRYDIIEAPQAKFFRIWSVLQGKSVLFQGFLDQNYVSAPPIGFGPPYLIAENLQRGGGNTNGIPLMLRIHFEEK